MCCYMVPRMWCFHVWCTWATRPTLGQPGQAPACGVQCLPGDRTSLRWLWVCGRSDPSSQHASRMLPHPPSFCVLALLSTAQLSATCTLASYVRWGVWSLWVSAAHGATVQGLQQCQWHLCLLARPTLGGISGVEQCLVQEHVCFARHQHRCLRKQSGPASVSRQVILGVVPVCAVRASVAVDGWVAATAPQSCMRLSSHPVLVHQRHVCTPYARDQQQAVLCCVVPFSGGYWRAAQYWVPCRQRSW